MAGLEALADDIKPTDSSQASLPSGNKEERAFTEVIDGEQVPDVGIVYLKGLRLHTLTFGICLSLFLTNLEIPIVTTSLVSITDDLHSFDQTSWIISSYLLGYVSMLIIWAKLSDVFGRKSIAVVSLFLFIVFSGACGAAQTMNQLILFRALQGLGGGGNFALGSIILLELVPPELFPKYTGIVSIFFSLSLLLGPILGGEISGSAHWRWIFLINVPIGALALAIYIFCLPNSFPHHGQGNTKYNIKTILSKSAWLRIDFLGAALLVITTSLFVAALEEAGQDYAWNSALVISLLTVAGAACIAFVLWERIVTPSSWTIEPVFPWRLMTSRIWMGMILNALFLGAPWFVTIFQLPQRFQVVDNVSPLSAGIRLIPFTLASPFGSAISAAIAGKAKVPPLYLVLFASALQVIGFALLSTLSTSDKTSNAQYGYQVIAGFGVGINISTLIIMTPYSVEPRDKSVAVGSVSQFRILGGVVGLAIATAVYKTFTLSRLDKFLTGDEIDTLLQQAENISLFSDEIQAQIRSIYAGGYNQQFKILTAFAAAQIPSSLLMWQKKQILV